MKTPDKIYLPIVQGRTRKDIRYDATYFAPTEFAEENIEYIRKDALLEWLKNEIDSIYAGRQFVGVDRDKTIEAATLQKVIDKLNEF